MDGAGHTQAPPLNLAGISHLAVIEATEGADTTMNAEPS